jgi:hypothetical protein
MPFNVSKCTVLHIKQQSPRMYHLEDIPLRPVTKQKDLGTLINSSLSFSENSAGAANKANKVMFLLHRNLGKLHPKCFTPIFKSMVRPHLEINSQACAPFLHKDTDALERVQRRATKRVSGLRNKDYPDRLRKLNLFSMSYRRSRGDMILTHKIMHNSNHPCTSLFHRKCTDNLRGHSMRLEHQQSKLGIRYHSFGVRVPRYWNRLPSSVVNAVSTNEFKTLYDQHHYNTAFEPSILSHDATYLRNTT